jgi:hypothetical protein
MRGFLLALLACGCSASMGGSDEGFATRLLPPPEGITLEPEPPSDVFFIRIASAEVPARTSGGQLWDEVGGWPDPLVILKVDGKEVMRTSSQEDTIHPTWSEPSGNIRIRASSTLRVEVEDSDAVRNLPIGSAEGGPPSLSDLAEGNMLLTFEGGKVVLTVQAAHALLGLGFDYQVSASGVIIGKVLEHSPAGRGGMKPGDVLVSIGSRQVSDMKPREVKSALNAVDRKPVDVIVRHKSGATATVKLVTGAVYPLFDEYGSLE